MTEGRKRSDRKEQAIYDAVHEVVMKLRVRAKQHPTVVAMDLDTFLAQAQHAAGMAAIAAYLKPLGRKKR